MSVDAKVAYILGLGNLVEYERHQLVGSPHTTSKSFLPHLARGLSGIFVNEVVSRVGAYYAAHPEQRKRPVVDTIFQAMVLAARVCLGRGHNVQEPAQPISR